MIDFLSRQSSAFGAHVPQKRSGTLRCRTESASEGPVRRAEATTMSMRMVVFRAGVRADEPGSGRVSGARTIELPRWPLASLASAVRADEPGSGRVSGEHTLE